MQNRFWLFLETATLSSLFCRREQDGGKRSGCAADTHDTRARLQFRRRLPAAGATPKRAGRPASTSCHAWSSSFCASPLRRTPTTTSASTHSTKCKKLNETVTRKKYPRLILKAWNITNHNSAFCNVHSTIGGFTSAQSVLATFDATCIPSVTLFVSEKISWERSWSCRPVSHLLPCDHMVLGCTYSSRRNNKNCFQQTRGIMYSLVKLLLWWYTGAFILTVFIHE